MLVRSHAEVNASVMSAVCCSATAAAIRTIHDGPPFLDYELSTAFGIVFRLEVTMLADKVEVSWDTAKSKWLVRIQSGEEIIRRFCDMPQGADEPALRTAAHQTTVDEGYEADTAGIVIKR
jgi:hypothetical protein